MKVLGTYTEFKKFVENSINSSLDNAIKDYLSFGGVLKVEDDLPLKIVYPTKSRLEEQLDATVKKEKYIDEQISHLNIELGSAKKLASGGVVKFSDPLLWKHMIKSRTDKNYKKAFDIVNPPVERIKDPKYRKMIEMFIKSPEYRERLVEARTSILGKKRTSIKESAEKSDDFKESTIDYRIKKLKKEKDIFTKRHEAYRVLLSNSTRIF